eukprot:3783037-Amphidinium_carterae.1
MASTIDETIDIEEGTALQTTTSGSARYTAYVIAEQFRSLLTALHQSEVEVLTSTHAHVKTGRTVPEDLQILATDLKQRPADLLWIQYQGGAKPGRRAQAKLLKEFFHALVRSHLPRHVIVECRSCDIPIREEIAQDPSWKELLPHQSHLRVCSLVTPEIASRCSGHMTLSSFPIPSTRCLPTCRQESTMTSVPQLDSTQSLTTSSSTPTEAHDSSAQPQTSHQSGDSNPH